MAAVTMKSTESCAMCLADEPIGESGLGHAAGSTHHVFHTSCLKSWLNKNHTCPTCREKITSINGVPFPTELSADHPGLAAFPREQAEQAAEIFRQLRQSGQLPGNLTLVSSRFVPLQGGVFGSPRAWTLGGRAHSD